MDFLADDVYVQPALRRDVLTQLAELLADETPQLQEAALAQYKRLALTQHRTVAAEIVKQRYAFDEAAKPDSEKLQLWLRVAQTLVDLTEQNAAWPIVQYLEGNSRTISQSQVQRLRFEGWPDDAADYLVSLQKDKESDFSVHAGRRLNDCTIGPVNADSVLRVLGEDGLCAVLGRLIDGTDEDKKKAALTWIGYMGREVMDIAGLVPLMQDDNPVLVQRLAAERLPETVHRDDAVVILVKLAEDNAEQAAAAAKALVEAGEQPTIAWQLIMDSALMPNDRGVAAAIGALLQGEYSNWGVAAAVHVFAQSRDNVRWAVAQALIEHGPPVLGLAAATWLALRPGFADRLEACEYEASRGLAMVPDVTGFHDKLSGQVRSELKSNIRAEWAQAYDDALGSFYALAQQRLMADGGDEEPLDEVRRLARASLGEMMVAMGAVEKRSDVRGRYQALIDSDVPAVQVNVALHLLQMGDVEAAWDLLVDILNGNEGKLSQPVRIATVVSLSQITGGGRP